MQNLYLISDPEFVPEPRPSTSRRLSKAPMKRNPALLCTTCSAKFRPPLTCPPCQRTSEVFVSARDRGYWEDGALLHSYLMEEIGRLVKPKARANPHPTPATPTHTHTHHPPPTPITHHPHPHPAPCTRRAMWVRLRGPPRGLLRVPANSLRPSFFVFLDKYSRSDSYLCAQYHIGCL